MKSIIPWKQKEDNSVSLWSDDWFDHALENPLMGFSSPVTKSFFRTPKIDVLEDKNEITVKAEIPGMTEKDIDLTWHDGILRIQGEKRDEKEEKKKNSYYRECSYGSFSRNIPLNSSVDWKKAQAKYKNGVLTVTLPKSDSSKKPIQIKVN